MNDGGKLEKYRIGCVLFEFRRPLDGLRARMFRARAVPEGPLFAARLSGRGIAYKLKFRWDGTRPVRENLARLGLPRAIRKVISEYGDGLRAMARDAGPDGNA